MTTAPVVSSFIVVLAEDADKTRVQEQILREGQFTIGETDGRRMAVAARDIDHQQAEQSFRWLQHSCQGVEYVDMLGCFLDPDQGD